MLTKVTKIDRDHTTDYEIITHEVADEKIYFLGIRVFRKKWDVKNTNGTEPIPKRKIGLAQKTNEKPT